MTDDTEAVSSAAPKRERGGVDFGLALAVWLLVAAVIGLASWFGWQVYQDYQARQLTNAPTRVIIALKAQVKESPNDVVLRVRLGEALGAAGDFSEATEQLNQALKIDPKHVGAHLDLGLIALLTKNETAGERYLKKVVELTDNAQYSGTDERREQALYNLGLLKNQQKEYEEAAGYFKGALRIRKDASDTYLALAQSFEGMGDYEAAIENAEMALQFDPGYAEAHYQLGRLYQRQKDDVNASYHFYQAFKDAPDAELVREALDSYGPAEKWIGMAEASLKKGDTDGAVKEVLIARNLDPKSLEAAKLHGRILIERENYSEALEVYLSAKELDSKDAETKKMIAEIEKTRPADALKAYERQLKAESTNKEFKAKVAELKKGAQ